MAEAANGSMRVQVRGPLRCEGPGRLNWGEEAETKARVAVRFLPLSANGEAAVKSLASLPEHPTLPKVREVGRAESEAFAILDFPQGRLLASLLERPLPLAKLLRIGMDLADALAAAHAQGIAHGELSAHSVLVLASGDALLWDLPMVFVDRLTDRRGEGRALQKLEMTAEFLAPERAAGRPATSSSDVWSLAALLCRAAGGTRPPSASTLGVVHLVANGEWTPRAPLTLPQRVRTLLSRMLSPDAASRPGALEVKEELAAMLLSTSTLQELRSAAASAVSAQPAESEAAAESSRANCDDEDDDDGPIDPSLIVGPRSAIPDVHSVPTVGDDALEELAAKLPSKRDSAPSFLAPAAPAASPSAAVATATPGASCGPNPPVAPPALAPSKPVHAEADAALLPWTDPASPVHTVNPSSPTIAAPSPEPRAELSEALSRVHTDERPVRNAARRVSAGVVGPRGETWRLVALGAAVAVPLVAVVLFTVNALMPDAAAQPERDSWVAELAAAAERNPPPPPKTSSEAEAPVAPVVATAKVAAAVGYPIPRDEPTPPEVRSSRRKRASAGSKKPGRANQHEPEVWPPPADEVIDLSPAKPSTTTYAKSVAEDLTEDADELNGAAGAAKAKSSGLKRPSF